MKKARHSNFRLVEYLKSLSNLLIFFIIGTGLLFKFSTGSGPAPETSDADDAAPRNGIVYVTGSQNRVNSGAFDRRLRTAEGILKRNKITSWAFNKKVYTLTALGTDFRHHVANSFLIGFIPFETDKLWVPLQTIASRLKYRQDKKQFKGFVDVWQTSKQAYHWVRGDCEDHAILLADWLIEMGYDARVAIGKYKTLGHAWVVLFYNNKTYILEATDKRKRKKYPLASQQPHFHPVMMFNRDFFWVNTGSPFTAVYKGRKWEKVSRFADT